jgi:hypothetical protein
MTWEGLKSVTIRQLYDCLLERSLLPELAGVEPDEVSLDEHLSGILGFFVDCGKTIRHYLEETSKLRVIDNDDAGAAVVEYDPDLLDIVGAFAKLVWAEYDNVGHTIEGPNIWKCFNLGSDSDVDFCGSYLEIAVDILREYDPDLTR